MIRPRPIHETLRALARSSMVANHDTRNALELAAAGLEAELPAGTPGIVIVNGEGADFLLRELEALEGALERERESIGELEGHLENIRHHVKAHRALERHTISDEELELLNSVAHVIEGEWGSGGATITDPLALELMAIVTRLRGDQ